MSNDSIEQPTFSNYTLSIIGALASLLLFLFIMFVAYLPTRPEPVDASIVEERTGRLETHQAEQQALVNTCEWIDEQNGIARIPVAHAKEIIVERLNAK